MSAPYPTTARERDQWLVARRPSRHHVDPWKPHALVLEEERSAAGEIVSVATLFLTNRECPWRCLMCDLWKNTVEDTVPVGAIPAQIDYALARLGSARQIKLYNSGSFFDPRAIPVADYEPIARRVAGFERVIVECHPALVTERVLPFVELLRRHGSAQLEVAMGLETAHPEVLEKLNKRVTLERFQRAARFLRDQGVALRVFILVKPPFLDEAEALVWACRSLDFAFDGGAEVACLIPTRAGNGAMEALEELGVFVPPQLSTLEKALAYGLSLGRGRVFADLWDLEKFSHCDVCFGPRRRRLQEMNFTQTFLPEMPCPATS